MMDGLFHLSVNVDVKMKLPLSGPEVISQMRTLPVQRSDPVLVSLQALKDSRLAWRTSLQKTRHAILQLRLYKMSRFIVSGGERLLSVDFYSSQNSCVTPAADRFVSQIGSVWTAHPSPVDVNEVILLSFFSLLECSCSFSSFSSFGAATVICFLDFYFIITSASW